MEALESAGCSNPRNVNKELVRLDLAAIKPRCRLTEISNLKKNMNFPTKIFQSLNSKRSRVSNITFSEQCDGEEVDFCLHQPSSEHKASMLSRSLSVSTSERNAETKLISHADAISESYTVLVRSTSFPLQLWEKGSSKFIVKSCNADTSAIGSENGDDKQCCIFRSKGGAAAYSINPSSLSNSDEVESTPQSNFNPPANCQDQENSKLREREKCQNESKLPFGQNDPPWKGILFSRNKASETFLDSTNSLTENNLKVTSSTLTQSYMADGKCPPHGKVSVLGRRREMEDTIAIVPYFAALPSHALSGSRCISDLHFFGVYDGHGGAQVSTYCKQRLHHALADEIARVAKERNASDTAGWWKKAMKGSFMKMDEEVGGISSNNHCSEFTEQSSDCDTDSIAPGNAGSTAVVAALSPLQIVVANCGDSRAVLSKSGIAIPLSRDQKPERDDEKKRIEAAGGKILYWDGYRVEGVLSMTRAIGDWYLKPFVIAEPEVIIHERTEEDECLILATDGLWDVVSNDLACEVAHKCLAKRYKSDYTSAVHTDTPAAEVAALLTKLALSRGSQDNISVVVVDLNAKQ